VKEVDHLLVHVDETGPRRGELVTEAFTQPYHMVKVSKSKKKVRFVHDAEIINGVAIKREVDYKKDETLEDFPKIGKRKPVSGDDGFFDVDKRRRER